MARGLILTFLAVALGTNMAVPARSGAAAQATALDTDCKSVGGDAKSGYQFIPTCAGRALSPDRRYAIVLHAYRDNQPPIELQDARGRVLGKLPGLRDDMPFRVFWAPNSRWVFVNHHVGSFMDEMQVFEIVGDRVFERKALNRSATRVAVGRYPCLPENMVLPNGTRWTRDGRHIVLVTVSAPYACSEFGKRPGTFKELWMIGDARTGRILPTSIRVDHSITRLIEPRDGIYARF